MVLVIRVIGLLLIVMTVTLWFHAVVSAPMIPESWDDDKQEYVRCSDCCWTCDDDYSLFGEPGPGCKDCPFCHVPGDHNVVE